MKNLVFIPSSLSLFIEFKTYYLNFKEKKRIKKGQHDWIICFISYISYRIDLSLFTTNVSKIILFINIIPGLQV